MYCTISERQAQEAERARSRTASMVALEQGAPIEDNTEYSKLVATDTIYKSQFYRAVYGVSPQVVDKAKKAADVAVKASTLKPADASIEGNKEDEGQTPVANAPTAPSLYFEKIGPVFQQVQSLSWDLATGFVAMTTVTNNRVTVLSCSFPVPTDNLPLDDDMSTVSKFAEISSKEVGLMSVVGTIQLSESITPAPLSCRVQSMYWYNGSLFVISPQTVHTVFPICSRVDSQKPSYLKVYPLLTLHQVFAYADFYFAYFASILIACFRKTF